jgi:hypothetical protein
VKEGKQMYTDSKWVETFSKAQKMYEILKPLELHNDCGLFVNQYEMMVECIDSKKSAIGRGLTVLKNEIDSLLYDLETMLLSNYAVRQYRPEAKENGLYKKRMEAVYAKHPYATKTKARRGGRTADDCEEFDIDGIESRCYKQANEEIENDERSRGWRD